MVINLRKQKFSRKYRRELKEALDNDKLGYINDLLKRTAYLKEIFEPTQNEEEND